MTKELVQLMQANASNLINQLIIDQKPFNLVIHQNDDWSSKLPESIMKQFPETLVLNISGEVFEHIEWDEGNPEITMMFGDEPFTKVIYSSDIVGIIDSDNQPMLINRIPQVIPQVMNQEPEAVEDGDKYLKPKNKEDWLKEVIKDGVTFLEAEKSVNSFMKNNPDIFKIKEVVND